MKEIYQQTLDKWHQGLKDRNPAVLDEILAEEVVFHSPVVWTPQEGKAITKLYLTGAMHVLGPGGFHYHRKVMMDQQAIMEFHTKIDDIAVEGVDIIRMNEEGKILEFKVMVRPLQAVNKIHQKMGEMLGRLKG